MITNKTYGYPIGFMPSGKKAHLARPDRRALCSTRGYVTRFLGDGEGVSYEVLCAECLRQRHRKTLGATYTQAQQELRATLRQEWGRRRSQDQILRRFR